MRVVSIPGHIKCYPSNKEQAEEFWTKISNLDKWLKPDFEYI